MSTTGLEQTDVEALVRAGRGGRSGALWRLGRRNRQLDANVVRVPPGAPVGEHVESQVDVLLVVVSGTGALVVDGVRREASRGAVVYLPRGARRAMEPGPEGIVFITAHRRRAGLRIGRTRPAGTGEAAHCTVHRVCRECHRHAIEVDARYCSRCGTPLPARPPS
ncbi:cupin domain-containing protein [Streptomyces sp. NPDC046887]|uniref:cupin domain-containing protein n=1 Tax=Streptomyces sp. NPDC046887 TaxID=3155472 RepID=UPI0033E65DB6